MTRFTETLRLTTGFQGTPASAASPHFGAINAAHKTAYRMTSSASVFRISRPSRFTRLLEVGPSECTVDFEEPRRSPQLRQFFKPV
jgi:hypothetical protein